MAELDEKPPTSAAASASEEAERAARRRRNQTGEADHGLWQRVSFRRAIVEGTVIYGVWRLLVLIPITFWPGGIFPLILLVLLVLRFTAPVWASMRIIATRREKMSRRFFKLAGILATTCLATDVAIALFVGDPAQPFGGPTYGPDIARLLGVQGTHPLGFISFLGTALATYGLLLAYYLIATICTRLAQGGFLRFTMPSGDGRVTL